MKQKKKLQDEFNSKDEFDPNRMNEAGQTALHFLAYEGKTAGIFVLLAAGADPNKADENGMTPLHYAALSGKIDAIEMLLKAGGNAAATTKDGQTVAEMARHKKHDELAMALEVLARKPRKTPPSPAP